jgi:hypothetical protein
VSPEPYRGAGIRLWAPASISPARVFANYDTTLDAACDAWKGCLPKLAADPSPLEAWQSQVIDCGLVLLGRSAPCLQLRRCRDKAATDVERGNGSQHLRKHKGEHIERTDAGECVRQRPRGSHGRIRKRRGGGEPIGRGDVQADRGCHGRAITVATQSAHQHFCQSSVAVSRQAFAAAAAR